MKESNLLHIKNFLFYSIYLLFSFLIILLVFFLTGGFEVPLPITEEVTPRWLELLLKEKANRNPFSAEELDFIKSAAACLSMLFSGLFEFGYIFGFSYLVESLCYLAPPWDLDPTFGARVGRHLALELRTLLPTTTVSSEVTRALFIALELEPFPIKPREIFPNLFPALHCFVYADLITAISKGVGASALFFPVMLGQVFEINPGDFMLFGGHFSDIYNPWIIQIISSIMGNDVSVLFSNSNPLSMLSLQSADIMLDTVAMKEEEIVVNIPWEAFFVPYVWVLEAIIGYLLFLVLMIDFFLNGKKSCTGV